MSSPQPLREALLAWAGDCARAGWISEGEREALAERRREDAGALFSGAEQTPLVVALFGGTGVGKSSLLNRLAGAEIARAGVVRPTSREVTVYAHRSLSLAALPAGIRDEQLRLRQHDELAQRHIVWIDTPDIDSVATAHRRQVLAWLPYVDALIYVVSPERYRDDAGWRLLQSAAAEHAWLFAMNHCDRAQPAQMADFGDLLATAGFARARVFRTDGRGAGADDDFVALLAAVAALGEAHNHSALRAAAERAESERLRQGAAPLAARFGEPEDWRDLQRQLREGAEPLAAALVEALGWQIHTLAARYPAGGGGWRALFGGAEVAPAPAPGGAGTAWSERAGRELAELARALPLAAAGAGLAGAPIGAALAPQSAAAQHRLSEAQQRALDAALACPGSRLQRLLWRAAAALAIGLPAAALGWVAWRVVARFYRAGTAAGGTYLGVDFVANSALLVAVAWLLPALLREQLRPSLRRSAERALRRGLAAGVEEHVQQLSAALTATAEDAAQRRRALAELLDAPRPAPPPPPAAAGEALRSH